MEIIFWIGFIIFIIIKSIISSSDSQRNQQRALDSFDFSEFSKNNGSIDENSFNKSLISDPSNAIEESYNYNHEDGEEVNGFVDPSNSFIPTQQVDNKKKKKQKLQEIQTEQALTKQKERIFKKLQASLNNQNLLNSNQKISFGKNDILKAFIMQELLQRHDINKIYERIPDIRRDE